MDNYQFCAHWVLDQEARNGIRVLDYGCGSGEIVEDLRGRGVAAFGCDLFYDGGDYLESIDADLLDGGIIKKMEGRTIPFDDSLFDFVVNNQVMEHVEDIDTVLAEIQRVLKPGGSVLSIFPTAQVWREVHCGVPFLHWFPRGSRVRVYYAAALRAVGFGYFKEDKSVMRWSRDFCEWLDRWTHYRTEREIESSYGDYLCELQHIEDYWLKRRLGTGIKSVATWLPKWTQRLVVRKLARVVIVAHTRRPNSDRRPQ